MSSVEDRGNALGLTLPIPVAAVANYVPAALVGSLLFVSGQLPFGTDGKLTDAQKGKLREGVDAAVPAEAAKLCALNLIAQAKAALGDLDRVARVVRLGGFFAVDGTYPGMALAMNGASDLIVAAFGDKGRHARTTVGVAYLPMNATAEVEAIFEIET
jgi:enamine deaminase RidA (YjgF/YER057c/UK114 family)